MPITLERPLFVLEHRYRGLIYRCTVTAPADTPFRALPYGDHLRDQIQALFETHATVTGDIIGSVSPDSQTTVRQKMQRQLDREEGRAA